MKYWCCLLVSFLYAGVALAAPSVSDLHKLEEQIRQEEQRQKESKKKSEELTREVQSVQKQMVALAKNVRRQEGQLSLLEQKKKELEEQQRTLDGRLALTNQQLARIMQGMQTLALRPTELLLFESKTPINMLRSKQLMQYSFPIVGGIQEQTKEDLAELSRVRADLQNKIQEIKSVTVQLSEKNQNMEKLAKQKMVLQAQYLSHYEKSKAKAQSLAKEAKDLKELLAKLEKERLAQQARAQLTPHVGQGAFYKAKGSLLLPVQGVITQNFGDIVGPSGAHVKGILIQTRPKAQITTPFDGTVLFAGPFQNYGQLIIIDHGDNYLTVMAGMDKIDAAVGQQLLAGEPVGYMKQNYTNLYLELRHSGQAIDPIEWFAT
ncbi:MAG: peptidoglycan DD-metalloendopeptidase family protein [Alphaproteobacteria bacterium]|nr:peptidoglycan DD-metalloendopeptidase family protein [Alphaproteobacteria bacterium]